MKKESYRKSLILIVVTAVTLTAAQVYFTIQNYQKNKLRFIDDVQQSLNTSIEDYFANRAKNDIMVFSSFGSDTLIENRRTSGFVKRFKNIDSIKSITIGNVSSAHAWTTEMQSDTVIFDSIKTEGSLGYKKLILDMDSSRVEELQFLTQKVMVSISEDLLDLGELYEVLNEELDNRELNVDFVLHQETGAGRTSIGNLDSDNLLSAEATSAYLGKLDSIKVEFENATLTILRRGISELVLSILLIGLVIGTLIHLYRTIFAQKQLAAIKDDLISNITHEFKTPIATIFSALEGVTNFNETNDQEKTRRYLALSNNQLKKLNNMVEKMLETATIDQGKLSLNKEEVDTVVWTREIVQRFALVEGEKQIHFECDAQSFVSTIDRFHMENVISNLIDNAIKYGGNEITVRMRKSEGKNIWEVVDNGGNIAKIHREQIFDKLYRIPTGNQHDVKGFGIGLYYARTIAELHEGALTLEVADNQTLFKLTI